LVSCKMHLYAEMARWNCCWIRQFCWIECNESNQLGERLGEGVAKENTCCFAVGDLGMSDMKPE
jgi:hypothetical protein